MPDAHYSFFQKVNIERSNIIKEIQSTTLTYENFPEINFINDYQIPELELISDHILSNDYSPSLSSFETNEDFFVVKKNDKNRTITLKHALTINNKIATNMNNWHVQYFIIKKFNQRFDISTINDYTVIPGIDNSLKSKFIFNNSKIVSKADLNTELNNEILRRFQSQLVSAENTDYTIQEWTQVDNTAINNSVNLSNKQTQYKTIIVAKPDSKRMFGELTITLTIPPLNFYNLNNLPTNINPMPVDFNSLSTYKRVDKKRLLDLLTQIIVKSINQIINDQNLLVNSHDLIIIYQKSNSNQTKVDGYLDDQTDLTMPNTNFFAYL